LVVSNKKIIKLLLCYLVEAAPAKSDSGIDSIEQLIKDVEKDRECALREHCRVTGKNVDDVRKEIEEENDKIMNDPTNQNKRGASDAGF